jgi:uncharacterized alpha/beta hydrolase family protein
MITIIIITTIIIIIIIIIVTINPCKGTKEGDKETSCKGYKGQEK